MQQVNALVSSRIGNYLTNKKTWESIVYNVLSYGAKGDGTTDDTTSVQTLINSIDQGEIVFPPGEYLITKQGERTLAYSASLGGYGILLLGKSNIKITMQPGAKILASIADASTFNVFWVEECEDVSFENPAFEGIGTTTSLMLHDGMGIIITESSWVNVDGPTSVNMRGCTRAYQSANVKISNGFSSIYANEHAGGHFALYSSQSSTIDSCISYGATDDGDIFVFGGNSRDCVISNSKSHGYVYNDATKTIFDNEAQGIMIDSGGRNCRITGCYVYGYYYGFDIKNGSEGCVIENCIAEKCKIGVSSRKGEGTSPNSTVSIFNNIVVPNGGNGNTNPFLGSITDPVGIAVVDFYGACKVLGNHIYNSIDVAGNLDFVGLVLGQSEDVSDDSQGGMIVTNNTFELENRMGSAFGTSRKQAIIITTSFRMIGILINNNNFDISQTGIVTNLIEAYNCQGLDVCNNKFSSVFTTGLPLIKFSGCFRVKIDSNNIGYHYGFVEGHSTSGLSISGNMSGESINATDTPTIFLDNCQYVKVNENTQILLTPIGNDVEYYKDANGTNWISIQNNMLRMSTKGPSDFYTSVAVNFLVTDNVVD